MVSTLILHCCSDQLDNDVLYRCGDCAITQQSGKIQIVVDANFRKSAINIPKAPERKKAGIDMGFRKSVEFSKYIGTFMCDNVHEIHPDKIDSIFDDLISVYDTHYYTREKNKKIINDILVFKSMIGEYAKR